MDILALALYLVLRFCFNTQLDAFGDWAMYAVEGVFAGTSLVMYRNSLRHSLALPGQLCWLPMVALFAGLFVAYGAIVIGLPVPFDTSGGGGIFLLLVVAPVLEEVLFRHFLWKPWEKRGKRTLAWWFTTILFAYAHWHPTWDVPIEWHGFLAYQTLYTLGLGLACGAMVYRWNSLPGAILLHAAFNLGFWLLLRIA